MNEPHTVDLSPGPGSAASTQDEQADLERLAAELKPHGCRTVLVTGEGRLPSLEVLNSRVPGLSGRVYASADDFWWGHAERIAPRDCIPAAAQAIASFLAPRGPAR